MILYAWAIGSVVAGFTAGWVIGKYGYSTVLKNEGNSLMAAELARTNRMEIRQ